MPPKTSSENVKVIVRVRPLNAKEKNTSQRSVIKFVGDKSLIFDPQEEEEPFFFHGVVQKCRDVRKKPNKHMVFTFDRVFGIESQNKDVFEASTKDLLSSILNGYNCSVFVYGATGTGKTHTMIGDDENPGITVLTMKELFEQINQYKHERDFELAISYLEVYNELVKDLLNPGPVLQLREDGKFGVRVTGITVKRITDYEQLFFLLGKGNENRTQHPTDANAESSRSHAVFQVYVNMTSKMTGQRRIAKLSMIDLAGSERGAATGCAGLRFTEGTNINRSLLALGNCINSLADGQKHIPYRDSKLTRLLKDSLGGNCQTVMIANVSPAANNYEDTYNTLKYAMRAKHIKSSMSKNVVSNTLTIPQYIQRIEELTNENESLKQQQQCKTTHQLELENVVDEKVMEEIRALLEDKLTTEKNILRLVNVMNILKLKIKCKESCENVNAGFYTTNNQLESGQNKMQHTIGSFDRQLKSVIVQLETLHAQLGNIGNKLQRIIKDNNIPDNNDILLKANSNSLNLKFQFMNQYCQDLITVYTAEFDHQNKVVRQSSELLDYYHRLLRENNLLTESMEGDYQNLVKTAQGYTSLTWRTTQSETIIDMVSSQDSGICCLGGGGAGGTTNEEENVKRKVKRKFYEVEAKITTSSTVDSVLEKFLIKNSPKTTPTTLTTTTTTTSSKIMTTTQTTTKTSCALNETICLSDGGCDTNLLNNTYSMDDKEMHIPKKKPATTINLLSPKVKVTTTKNRILNSNKEKNKCKSDKLVNAMSRFQRFPLRTQNDNNTMVKSTTAVKKRKDVYTPTSAKKFKFK